ncbi:hypothetical protein R6Q59_013263 [Mikania micrantha]
MQRAILMNYNINQKVGKLKNQKPGSASWTPFSPGVQPPDTLSLEATANLVPLNAKQVAVKFDAFKVLGLIPIRARGSGRGQLEITYLDEELSKQSNPEEAYEEKPTDSNINWETKEEFMSEEVLVGWVKGRTLDNGYIVVKRRSKKSKTTGSVIKVWLMCDRGGEHNSIAIFRRSGLAQVPFDRGAGDTIQIFRTRRRHRLPACLSLSTAGLCSTLTGDTTPEATTSAVTDNGLLLPSMAPLVTGKSETLLSYFLLHRKLSAMKVLNFRSLIIFSAFLRALLIVYGEWQDTHMEVRYRDVDYLVLSDAAALVVAGNPPTKDPHTVTLL